MTALGTANIQIDGLDVDIYFETQPGTLNECSLTGSQIRHTGTVTTSFTPGAAGSRRIDLSGAPGLTGHVFGLATVAAAMRGSLTATGLLNVLD
jgi:hypothetical protein